MKGGGRIEVMGWTFFLTLSIMLAIFKNTLFYIVSLPVVFIWWMVINEELK